MDRNYERVRRIMLATNKIDGVYYLFAKQFGNNENTLAFLYALADGKPHSQKEISEEWLIPRTTINSIVKKMLAQGYVAFVPEQHRKEKALMLTDSGMRYTDERFGSIYAAEEKAIVETMEQYDDTFVEALEFFASRLQGGFHSTSQRGEGHGIHRD